MTRILDRKALVSAQSERVEDVSLVLFQQGTHRGRMEKAWFMRLDPCPPPRNTRTRS